MTPAQAAREALRSDEALRELQWLTDLRLTLEARIAFNMNGASLSMDEARHLAFMRYLFATGRLSEFVL